MSKNIPAEFQDAMKRELDAGEKITWAGMPSATISALAATFTMAFGIVWISLPAMGVARRYGWFGLEKAGPQTFEGSGFGLLMLGLFVIAGLWLVLAPLIEFVRAFLTIHVVTDRRIVSMTSGITTKTRSYYSKDILGVERRDITLKTGTLTIDRGAYQTVDGKGRQKDHWYGIADARSAELAIRKLLSAKS